MSMCFADFTRADLILLIISVVFIAVILLVHSVLDRLISALLEKMGLEISRTSAIPNSPQFVRLSTHFKDAEHGLRCIWFKPIGYGLGAEKRVAEIQAKRAAEKAKKPQGDAPAFCPSCGGSISPEDHFCKSCGTRL